MPRPFKPWPYQRRMIEFALAHERCALFVPMGMGKTSACLAIVRMLLDLYGDTPVLVVAPKAVALATWPAEADKWSDFSGIRVSVIVGDPAKRKAAVEADADLYVINYDALAWLDGYLREANLPWKWPTVIADESTRLKHFRTRQGSERGRALGRHAGEFRRFIALTGTPAPNGIKDLWGQLWFIDAGRRLGKSYEAFMARWFQPVRAGANAFAVKWLPREFAAGQIQTAIADVCLSIRAEDYFDLGKPVFVTREIQLEGTAADMYASMEKELYVELSSGEAVEALNAAARTVKCLQIASGALYTDDQQHWQPVHDLKLQALRSIAEEAAGEPLLVAYQFKSDLARILEAFPEAVAFDGSRQMVDGFNAGRIPMLLVHPASAGHGISLQDGSSKIVFYSQWWDLEQWQQVIERIGPMRQLQAGHPRVVTVYSIIAAGTVDEAALDCKVGKKRVQDALLDYIRNKNTPRLAMEKKP